MVFIIYKAIFCRVHVGVADHQPGGGSRSRGEQQPEPVRLPHHLVVHPIEPVPVREPGGCSVHDIQAQQGRGCSLCA